MMTSEENRNVEAILKGEVDVEDMLNARFYSREKLVEIIIALRDHICGLDSGER